MVPSGPGWGPDESDPFASDLTVGSLPGSLARSWSAPYAGHLFRFPTHSGPILPPAWEPCSGLLVMGPLMDAPPSPFMGDSSFSFQFCPEDLKCNPWPESGL